MRRVEWGGVKKKTSGEDDNRWQHFGETWIAADFSWDEQVRFCEISLPVSGQFPETVIILFQVLQWEFQVVFIFCVCVCGMILRIIRRDNLGI